MPGRPWRLRSCSIFLVVDAPVQCCRALTVAIPQVQFLVLLMTCLSLCYDRCRVRQCRKPCWCRSCVRGRGHPCRGAAADSLGLSIVILQLQSIDKVVDVPVGRVQSVRRQPSSHSCTCLIHAWTRSFTRPLCATTDAWWFRALYTGTGPEVVSTGTRSPEYGAYCAVVSTKTLLLHLVRTTTTTTTTTTTRRFTQELPFRVAHFL